MTDKPVLAAQTSVGLAEVEVVETDQIDESEFPIIQGGKVTFLSRTLSESLTCSLCSGECSPPHTATHNSTNPLPRLLPRRNHNLRVHAHFLQGVSDEGVRSEH